MSRLTLLFVCLGALGIASVVLVPPQPIGFPLPEEPLPPLENAQDQARKARALVTAAVALPPERSARGASDAARASLGSSLADYAKNPAGDPILFENFIDATRRIIGLDGVTKQTPSTTSRDLTRMADAILQSLAQHESTLRRPLSSADAASLRDLRATALLARYHALRIVAAMHYNFFLRERELAELLAATLKEKETVAVWTELAALQGPPATGDWQAESKKLQLNLRELEEQCCPPDAAVARQRVWDPASDIPIQIFGPQK